MATTYQDYLDGKATYLKFSKNLVFGWLIEINSKETRYALFETGLILKSEPISIFERKSDEFAPKGMKWAVVSDIPRHAEFIGNYPIRNINTKI